MSISSSSCGISSSDVMPSHAGIELQILGLLAGVPIFSLELLNSLAYDKFIISKSKNPTVVLNSSLSFKVYVGGTFRDQAHHLGVYLVNTRYNLS